MTDDGCLVILLIDDDPGDVLMITEAFAALGLPREIRVAGDGVEAMEYLNRCDTARPDLIILDLNMPRMDGRETLTALKADPALSPIPVVVFTTSAAESDVAGSYLRGANAYVTKPVDLDGLDRAVQQIDAFYAGVARLPRMAA